MPALRAFILLLALCWGAVCAQGQDFLPAAGGFAYSPGEQSHAWVALEMTSPVLIHLPPRYTSATSVVDGADPGSTRLVMPLTRMPIAIAALENRAFLLFDPEPGVVGPGDRPVLSVRAIPGPMGSVWSFDNMGGRLEALPSLHGRGTVLSMVGSDRGPAALIRGSGVLEALMLDLKAGASSWRPFDLPDGISADHASLVAVPRGVGLVQLGGNRPGMWMGSILEQGYVNGDPRGPVQVSWRFQPFSLATGKGGVVRTVNPIPGAPTVRVGNVLAFPARAADGSLEIWDPSISDVMLVGTLKEVEGPFGLAALDDVGRVAVIWAKPTPPPPGARPGTKTLPEVHIAELSILERRAVYNGIAQAKGPVSPDELKLLAVALVVVMAMILLFVLKPEESRAPVNLPGGFALAEPGRRIIASVIDVVIASIITSGLTGRSVIDLLFLTGVFTDPAGMLGLLTLATCGFAIGTVGECTFGRTPGKALAGCFVAVPRMVQLPDGGRSPELSPPSFWRAIVRNLLKWFAPPIAMMGLSGTDHRHRGDIAAGTVVVITTEEP
jgi:hypothetical protein